MVKIIKAFFILFLKDYVGYKKDNTIEIGPLFRQLELENWSDLESKLPLIYQSINNSFL